MKDPCVGNCEKRIFWKGIEKARHGELALLIDKIRGVPPLSQSQVQQGGPPPYRANQQDNHPDIHRKY